LSLEKQSGCAIFVISGSSRQPQKRDIRITELRSPNTYFEQASRAIQSFRGILNGRGRYQTRVPQIAK